MSVGTGHGAAVPEAQPGGPRRPGKKWAVALAGLIGIYLTLAVHGLIANAGAIKGGTPAKAETSASSQVTTKTGSRAATKSSALAPGMATKPSARPLGVTSVAAFGPEGTADGDNPGIASRVIDVGTDMPWYSQWYATPEFGGLRSGTGLLVDLAQTATVTGVRLTLGSEPGASVQVRAGNGLLTDMPTVASASGIAGTVTLTVKTPARANYVLIWFTELPLSSPGKYQVSVYDVTVDGTAS